MYEPGLVPPVYVEAEGRPRGRTTAVVVVLYLGMKAHRSAQIYTFWESDSHSALHD